MKIKVYCFDGYILETNSKMLIVKKRKRKRRRLVEMIGMLCFRIEVGFFYNHVFILIFVVNKFTVISEQLELSMHVLAVGMVTWVIVIQL